MRFKILVGILVIMLGFMVRAVYTGGAAPLFSQIVSFVTVPAQRFTTATTGKVTGFFERYLEASALYEENQALRAERNELLEKLVEYDRMRHENEQFRDIIGFLENDQGIIPVSASVIARDPAHRFYSFSIDRGTLDGVSRLDPVMTADGLVGYVSEAGLNSAKVVTILDVGIDVGAYNQNGGRGIGVFDSATRDIGIVTGTVELAGQQLCKMDYLPRDSEAKPGDIILTSGGSLFPKDIVIGEIMRMDTSEEGTSLTAVIKPSADIASVKDVFVIVQFKGQGNE